MDENGVFHQGQLSLLRMKAGNKERPWLVVCIRTGEESGELDLGKR